MYAQEDDNGIIWGTTEYLEAKKKRGRAVCVQCTCSRSEGYKGLSVSLMAQLSPSIRLICTCPCTILVVGVRQMTMWLHEAHGDGSGGGCPAQCVSAGSGTLVQLLRSTPRELPQLQP